VEAALEAGIRHFDTAPSYSWGQSEQVLGHVLKGVRDVTITTKVGRAVSSGGPTRLSTIYRRTLRPALTRVPKLKSALLRMTSRPRASSPIALCPILTAAAIEQSLAKSLERLQRDRVDLFLLHDPESFILEPDALQMLERLRAIGIIRAYGEAWGGSPTSAPIGSVVQQRYPSEAPLWVQPATATHIYHGLLRHPDHSASNIRRLADAYARSTTSGFLFSASSSKQVRQVAEAIRQISTEGQSIVGEVR